MNKNVISFIQFMTDNNELGIANAMFNERVSVPKGGDIRTRLYQLFGQDRKKFIRVMEEAGFNKGVENYTTSKSTREAQAQTLNAYRRNVNPNLPVLREDTEDIGARWYETVLDTLVGGTETEATTTTTTTAPASGTMTKNIMIGVGAFVAVGLLVWIGIKFLK